MVADFLGGGGGNRNINPSPNAPIKVFGMRINDPGSSCHHVQVVLNVHDVHPLCSKRILTSNRL